MCSGLTTRLVGSIPSFFSLSNETSSQYDLKYQQMTFKFVYTVKPVLKWPLKNRQNKDLNDKW